MATVKSLWEFVIMQLTKEIYFYDIHFKIMTSNIMQNNIRLLGIPYKYTIKKVKHYLFDSASYLIEHIFKA